MKRPAYEEHDYAFGQAMQTLRTTIGLTQASLAQMLGVSRRAVGEWEAGSSYPKAQHLQHLLELAVQQRIFPAGREAEEIRAFWQAAHQKVLLDESWLAALLPAVLPEPSAPPGAVPVAEAAGAQVGSAPPPAPSDGARASPPGPPPPSSEPLASRVRTGSSPQMDWGEALDVPGFYGREEELAMLARWVLEERCRVVSVLGLGGVGKSALSVALMRQVASHFQVVLWRSLRDAPDCSALLADCLRVVSPQPLADPPNTVEARLGRLRMLLVLDNLESVLEAGEARGQFRSDHEDYARLLQAIAGEPVTFEELRALLVARLSPVQVLEALDGVRRRSLIEQGHRPGSFTLHPVVLEYVTGHLLDQLAGEIVQGRSALAPLEAVGCI